MRMDELRTGLYVQSGAGELFQVSSVYADSATFQVLMPKPPRTSVRTLTRTEIDKLRPASRQAINLMEDSWGLAPMRRRPRA